MIENAQKKKQPRKNVLALRGTIQRNLDELKSKHIDWIKRTHNLKFRRVEDRTDE